MAIFNQQSSAKKDAPAFATETAAPPPRETPPMVDYAAMPTSAVRASERSEAKESLIASDLTIEGKIEGSGHVRIAGRFKGDVNVQGDLTIEKDAKLNGGVRAKKVTVAGELEGNIEAAVNRPGNPGGCLV